MSLLSAVRLAATLKAMNPVLRPFEGAEVLLHDPQCAEGASCLERRVLSSRLAKIPACNAMLPQTSVLICSERLK